MPTLRPNNPTFMTILAFVSEDQRSSGDAATVDRMDAGPAGVPPIQTDGPRHPESRSEGPGHVQATLASTPGGARLDLDVHPSRQAELIQRVDRLVGGLHDIDQALV